MKCKVFISDEGYGPIVRQSAIINKLKTYKPNLSVTIQTNKHLKPAQTIIAGADHFIDRYNNITWDKMVTGSPDLNAITNRYSNYARDSDSFIKKELGESDHDFFISDFVYEAFEVARIKNMPSFGVCHFTWDWFFCKLYPPAISQQVLKRFFDFAVQADVLFFPPFTPDEILSYYKSKAIQVPLIVREQKPKAIEVPKDKFKILIMDSGSGVLHEQILNVVKQIDQLKDFHFFISDVFKVTADNISVINQNELMSDYIPQMDLVIARAGFNTISECIASRTPMLLINEAMNPEMNENIINIKQKGLGSFISISQFNLGLDSFLLKFIGGEYDVIKANMVNHNMKTNGAEIIATHMLNFMDKKLK